MQRNGEYIKCLVCDTEIYVIPARKLMGRGKYCSKRCMGHGFAGRTGELSPSFKGETHTFITKNGRTPDYKYRYVRSQRRKAFAPEHIVIAEDMLGRRLKKGECVHHMDCDPLNNEKNNLVICTSGFHSKLHWAMSELYANQHFGGKGIA